MLPLLAKALEDAGGELFYNHRLTAVSHSDAHASCTIDTPAGEVRMRAPWVAGCDGARSAVRQSLGVPFPGKTYEDRFLLATTDLELADVYPESAPWPTSSTPTSG